MNNETLSLQDIKIGDWLADKHTHFPMQVVAIHADGTVHLNFNGNEADPFEYNIESLERSAPIVDLSINKGDKFYFVAFNLGTIFTALSDTYFPGMRYQIELLMAGNFFLHEEQAQKLADELNNTLNKYKANTPKTAKNHEAIISLRTTPHSHKP